MSTKRLILLVAAVLCLAALAAPLLAADGKPTVILYGSRYGSTEQTARWIAEGMGGQADLRPVAEAGDLKAYTSIVLGSGIYYDLLHQDMAAFLAAHKAEIADRVVALFVVCGACPEYTGYLDTFAQALGRKPALGQSFAGWLKKERLSREDSNGLEEYYKSVNRPFENWDRTSRESAVAFGAEILKAIQPK